MGGLVFGVEGLDELTEATAVAEERGDLATFGVDLKWWVRDGLSGDGGRVGDCGRTSEMVLTA